MARAGRYREVHPEGKSSKDPAPLKVKEVRVDKHRYIIFAVVEDEFNIQHSNTEY
jgi:hypothetical protein